MGIPSLLCLGVEILTFIKLTRLPVILFFLLVRLVVGTYSSICVVAVVKIEYPS